VSAAKRPYWQEFLLHPRNQLVVAGLGAFTTLLSFPYGADALILGSLALAGVQALGLAIVPGLPQFRAAVDARQRRGEREQRRRQLMEELGQHGGSQHLAEYEAMIKKVQSLSRLARSGAHGAGLSAREVEQLDDLSVDYLRLCLSDAVMRGSGRHQALEKAARQAQSLEQRLADPALASAERADLETVLNQLQDALARGRRLAARRSGLDAALLSMPVQLDEIYQLVMAAPHSPTLGPMLEDSLNKLRHAERAAVDVEMSSFELERTLGEQLSPSPSPPLAARQRQAQNQIH
jgi:hypothetical protein